MKFNNNNYKNNTYLKFLFVFTFFFISLFFFSDWATCQPIQFGPPLFFGRIPLFFSMARLGWVWRKKNANNFLFYGKEKNFDHRGGSYDGDRADRYHQRPLGSLWKYQRKDEKGKKTKRLKNEEIFFWGIYSCLGWNCGVESLL